MLNSKKKCVITGVLIFILTVILTGFICTTATYIYMKKSMEIKYSDYYGTYQIDITDIDNPEYIAIMPSSDSNPEENSGEFQWYNANDELLYSGSIVISDEVITLLTDNEVISSIIILRDNNYFICTSVSPQTIVKISNEPMVISSSK